MKTIRPMEELPVVVYESKDTNDDAEEDPEEEYEEYIEEVSEEELKSDSKEDLEEEESKAEPNKDAEEDLEEDPEEEDEEYIEEVSEEEAESDSKEDLEEVESKVEPNENAEEDLEEEYEEYIEEVSEEEAESDSKEDFEEEESKAEPNEETADEAAVSKALDVESALKERRRATRWDSQPEQGGETTEGDKGIKVRKTRWDSDVSQLKTVAPLQLPPSVSDILDSVDSETDAELRKLKEKIIAINREIHNIEVCKGKPTKEESRRKHMEILLKNRINLLADLIIKNARLRVPQGCGRRKDKLFKKNYVPVKEYPSYNFIGLIMGPRGNTQKKMEVETGASIKLRGKGSLGKDIKDHFYEDLHVYIEAHTRSSLDAAVAMVEKLLIPVDDKDNKFKLAQLEELANLKGNDFKRCKVCDDPSHRAYACPNRESTFEEATGCTKCGSFSHHTSQCPLNKKAHPIGEINEANLYVGSLPQTIDENWLKERFCPFGKILTVRVIKDQTTGLGKGYGFVNFESPADAAIAVKHMNGHQVEGKTLAVRVAGLPPQPKLPVLNPLPPYPRPAAISAYIPGHAGPWVAPTDSIFFLQLLPPPGLTVLNPIPPYPRPAAISPNFSSQIGPLSGPPDPSQMSKDVRSHYDPSYVLYAKQASHSSSGSSQFPSDPDYRGSSSLFPGDPDYRGSSSLFFGF